MQALILEIDKNMYKSVYKITQEPWTQQGARYLIRIQCLQNLQSKEECIYKVLAVNSCSGGSSSIKYKIEPNSSCEKDHKLMQYKKFYLKISKI